MPYSLSHHPPFFPLILTSPSFSYTFARRRKWTQHREIVSGGDTVDTCLVGKKKKRMKWVGGRPIVRFALGSWRCDGPRA